MDEVIASADALHAVRSERLRAEEERLAADARAKQERMEARYVGAGGKGKAKAKAETPQKRKADEAAHAVHGPSAAAQAAGHGTQREGHVAAGGGGMTLEAILQVTSAAVVTGPGVARQQAPGSTSASPSSPPKHLDGLEVALGLCRRLLDTLPAVCKLGGGGRVGEGGVGGGVVQVS